MTFNPQTVLEEYDKMDLERGERWVLLASRAGSIHRKLRFG